MSNTLGKPDKLEALDKMGATASFACAVHCALMPLIVTFLPLMGLSILASEPVEWGLFALSGILGTTSLCFGFKRHRSKTAIAVLACGLALLSIGRLMHAHHTHHAGHGFDLYVAFLVLGGVTVTVSHWINFRLCKSCKRCQHGHCDVV